MATITIRNVPEKTHAALVERARDRGQSLQQYLREELIVLAAPNRTAAIMARVRERNRISGVGVSTDQILGHRNADRR